MRVVIFHFPNGTYISIFGYGATEDECITDAQLSCTFDLEDVISINTREPYQSEL